MAKAPLRSTKIALVDPSYFDVLEAPILAGRGFQSADLAPGSRVAIALLSLAGIYAVLSFTVARRTREIGVRVALGANPRRVLTATFRRPLTQVGLGIAAGASLIAAGTQALSRTTQFEGTMSGLSAGQVALLVTCAVFMLGVCLLACVVPTLRALRVEPIVAMKVE